MNDNVNRMLLQGYSRLKAIRIGEAGITQDELARRTKLTQSYISELEAGKRPGTHETIALLAKHLNVDVKWLA